MGQADLELAQLLREATLMTIQSHILGAAFAFVCAGCASNATKVSDAFNEAGFQQANGDKNRAGDFYYTYGAGSPEKESGITGEHFKFHGLIFDKIEHQRNNHQNTVYAVRTHADAKLLAIAEIMQSGADRLIQIYTSQESIDSMLAESRANR